MSISIFKGIKEGPLDRGWVVVAACDDPKNADDLHVMRAYRDAESSSFIRHNGAKLNLKVLCEPLRYRAQARKEKKKLVEALKLSRSNYVIGCDEITDHNYI